MVSLGRNYCKSKAAGIVNIFETLQSMATLYFAECVFWESLPWSTRVFWFSAVSTVFVIGTNAEAAMEITEWLRCVDVAQFQCRSVVFAFENEWSVDHKPFAAQQYLTI